MGKQPEGKLSRKIIDEWTRREVWCFKVHGSEFQPAGIPDIIGVYRGLFIGCETKMPGGKLSEIQKHRIRRIRHQGGFVIAGCTSIGDAVQMIVHLDEYHTGPSGRDSHHHFCPYRDDNKDLM